MHREITRRDFMRGAVAAAVGGASVLGATQADTTRTARVVLVRDDRL